MYVLHVYGWQLLMFLQTMLLKKKATERKKNPNNAINTMSFRKHHFMHALSTLLVIFCHPVDYPDHGWLCVGLKWPTIVLAGISCQTHVLMLFEKMSDACVSANFTHHDYVLACLCEKGEDLYKSWVKSQKELFDEVSFCHK